MKQYTQDEFDDLPRDKGGIKRCPSGDYSCIRSFGERCSFGEGASFGEWSSFGGWCSFEGRKAKSGNPYIAFDRSASSLRKTYIFNFEDGIYVRAGCFFGTLAEFRAAVEAEHGDTLAGRQYQAFADIAQMTFGEGRR